MQNKSSEENPPVDVVTSDGKKLEIEMYGNIAIQPSRAVQTLLEIAHVKYGYQEIELGMSGLKLTPEMLKLNPGGRAPFLVVNGKTMIESSAILRFLARTLPQLESYYSVDPFTC